MIQKGKRQLRAVRSSRGHRGLKREYCGADQLKASSEWSIWITLVTLNSTVLSPPGKLAAACALQSTVAVPVSCTVTPRCQSMNTRPAAGLTVRFPKVISIVFPS